MPELTRQKITFAEMRSAGVRGLLIYCSEYKCSHSTAISGDRWPDDVRLSDVEPLFTCQVCGQKGADVGPDFGWEEAALQFSVSESHPLHRLPVGPRRGAGPKSWWRSAYCLTNGER